MTASAIYEGTVRHRRFSDHTNEFTAGIALAYVDLEELPGLLGGRLVGDGRKLVRFRRRDYLGDPSVPLERAVRDVAEERTGFRPAGPIRLLTQLRSFGHCFNPVSFYYCFGADGERVEAIVAEVTNTPWGERHAYAIRRQDDSSSAVLSGDSEKVLHVSPFMGMDHRYEWRVANPADTLSVHIESRRGGQVAFDATLSMRRRELSRRSLAGITARYPAATARVLALIYAHAVRLKLKGASVHPHPRESTT
ncbi:MAG: uncharacterized protein QOC95_1501 [Thermoleophilaceae bacterium]|jgi:DUF1365 family protein|nr:uncharacterized protein [Thermoleophilaceae bacterium]